MMTELAKADFLAERVLEALRPFCKRLEVAGSVRRRRPLVNDLDIVLIPAGLKETDLLMARIEQSFYLVTGRQAQPQNVIFKSHMAGFQLDLFFAREGAPGLFDPIPSNWGAVFLCRTGSRIHNSQLARKAHEFELKFSPYKGLVKETPEGEKIVAGETEESIYEALGLKWREPVEREAL